MIRYLAYLLVSTLLVLAGLWGLREWVAADSPRSTYTPDPTPLPYSVGIDHLLVPRNFMRSAAQRGTSRGGRLDLAIHWPSGSGYGVDLKNAFEQTPEQLITITLTPREMATGMNERLSSVYAELFEGEPLAGPGALLLQPLETDSAYGGEALLIAAQEVEPWVARCQIDSNLGSVLPDTTCLHDYQTGKSLSVTYRFDSRHLTDWREIDTLVRETVATLLAR